MIFYKKNIFSFIIYPYLLWKLTISTFKMLSDIFISVLCSITLFLLSFLSYYISIFLSCKFDKDIHVPFEDSLNYSPSEMNHLILIIKNYLLSVDNTIFNPTLFTRDSVLIYYYIIILISPEFKYTFSVKITHKRVYNAL